MTDDVGDEQQVKKRKTKDQLRRERGVAELQAILATKGGRAFVWRLLEKCGVYSASFRGEDTHSASFAEGRRSIGLRLLEEVFTADPNCYTIMRSEAVERK